MNDALLSRLYVLCLVKVIFFAIKMLEYLYD